MRRRHSKGNQNTLKIFTPRTFFFVLMCCWLTSSLFLIPSIHLAINSQKLLGYQETSLISIKKIIEEVSFTKPASHLQCQEGSGRSALTFTCSHHTLTVKKLVTMWKHTASGTCCCYMIAALGKLSEDDIKAELCMVVRSIMNIKSQGLRNRSTFL